VPIGAPNRFLQRYERAQVVTAHTVE